MFKKIDRGVLDRYERNSDGTILINVAAASAEDLFNNFDKNAPYIRRDLDQNLVDYLIDCARELGAESFSIRFTLTRTPGAEHLTRIQRSIYSFFLYLAEIERHKVRKMMRRSLLLLLIGLAILSISVWVNQSLVADSTVLAHVFAEGLTVAAWVSLWEALATFMLEWFPHQKEIRLYRRLAHAQLDFGAGRNEDEMGSDHSPPTE